MKRWLSVFPPRQRRCDKEVSGGLEDRVTLIKRSSQYRWSVPSIFIWYKICKWRRSRGVEYSAAKWAISNVPPYHAGSQIHCHLIVCAMKSFWNTLFYSHNRLYLSLFYISLTLSFTFLPPLMCSPFPASFPSLLPPSSCCTFQVHTDSVGMLIYEILRTCGHSSSVTFIEGLCLFLQQFSAFFNKTKQTKESSKIMVLN